MREHFPLLVVGAVAGVLSGVFLFAYLSIRKQKEAIGFDRLLEIFFFQVSGVIMLQNRHTGIGAQGGRQLTEAYIQRINLFGAVLQQAIGKASGGGAQIQTHQSCGIERKALNGLLQF